MKESNCKHILDKSKMNKIITKVVVIYVRSVDGSIMKKSYHNTKDEARKVCKEVNDMREEKGVWAYVSIEVIE